MVNYLEPWIKSNKLLSVVKRGKTLCHTTRQTNKLVLSHESDSVFIRADEMVTPDGTNSTDQVVNISNSQAEYANLDALIAAFDEDDDLNGKSKMPESDRPNLNMRPHTDHPNQAFARQSTKRRRI